MKRDVSNTGNKKLRPSTVRSMNNDNLLLALRKTMGPSATGFQSNNCEYEMEIEISIDSMKLKYIYSGKKTIAANFTVLRNYFDEQYSTKNV